MLAPWLLMVTAIASVESARILAMFPLPSKSHHFVFRPIIEELGKRGHEVVYVTGFPYEKVPANITEINIFNYFLEHMDKSQTKFDHVGFGELSVPLAVLGLFELGLVIAGPALGNPVIQKLIHSDEKFDAVMFESYFVQEYLSAFTHKFGAVGIEVMPLGDCAWVNEMSAIPDNPSYQIDYKNENTNVLNFWQRLYNVYVSTSATLGGYFYLWRMQNIVDKYFNYTGWETRPPLTQLAKNRSLVLTNSHFAVGYASPMAPHRKEIGGINVKPNKPLPEDLQKYLDSAKNGVVYMSLGSNINVSDSANLDLQENFMSVFKQLPQNVLMKWETEYPGKLPANVKLSPWLPQQDILAHKNVVLFITHGGLLSINEAIHHGKPLVGIPFFGDQAKNMIQVETSGYGRMIRFRNLTKDTISWTVREVLSNPRYKKEALRRSEMFRDRRHSPAEEASYWIEHSIKYPNALTPRGAFISSIELHNIDIIIFSIFLMLATFAVTCKVTCLIVSSFKKTPKKLKKH